MFQDESSYQEYLIPKIYECLPGRKIIDTIVIITDPVYTQGIPDLLVLHRGKWAFLEVKLTERSKMQPNQQWWLDNWGKWTFTAIIHPGNEEEVLRALQQSLAG